VGSVESVFLPRTRSSLMILLVGLAVIALILLWGLVLPYNLEVLGLPVGSCRGLDAFDTSSDFLGRKSPCLESARNRVLGSLSAVAVAGLLVAGLLYANLRIERNYSTARFGRS
jgi:hypothetical protein